MLHKCECGEVACGMEHPQACQRKAVVQVAIKTILQERRLCLACGFALIITGTAVQTIWKRRV